MTKQEGPFPSQIRHAGETFSRRKKGAEPKRDRRRRRRHADRLGTRTRGVDHEFSGEDGGTRLRRSRMTAEPLELIGLSA